MFYQTKNNADEPEILDAEFIDESESGDQPESPEVQELSDITGLSVQDILKGDEAIELDEEEIAALQVALADMLREKSPEMAKFMEELSPRLDKLIDEIHQFQAKGMHVEAAEALMNFMESEEKKVSIDLPDGELKEEILARLGIAIDLAKLEEDANAQANLQKWLMIKDCIPIYGSVKMLKEAYKGKTVDGVELTKNGRRWKVAEATTMLALDAVWIGGLLLGGAPSAAVTAGKAGATGKKALDAGRVITRFAAFIRKSTKFTKASRMIFKAGMVVRKYPKLAQVVMKYGQAAKISKASKIKDVLKYQKERQKVYGEMKAYKYSEADRRNREAAVSAESDTQTEMNEAA